MSLCPEAALNSNPSNAGSLYFKGSYYPQNWSIPNSIIYYLAMNPTSFKAYEKLIQCCKYFFGKNATVVCSCLIYDIGIDESHIRIEHNKETKSINLNNISQKLWITNDIYVDINKIADKECGMSSIIPHFYRCDIKNLSLWSQKISFNEYILLISSAEYIGFDKVRVVDEDGRVVPFEKLVEVSPKATHYDFIFNDIDTSVSSETVKNLIKIPHFLTLNEAFFFDTPETFDIETFFDYVKKNKKTSFTFYFFPSISEAYKNCLEAAIDEIIGAEDHDYIPPYIKFHGQDNEKKEKLYSFFNHSPLRKKNRDINLT